MNSESKRTMELRINELESKLEESEQLINAIKAGEVDAFAINKNNESEIYTLQSGDYDYRVLIEEFSEGALNVTEDGLIVYTNSYFCNLINVLYEKVIGSHFADFVHPENGKYFKELLHQSLFSGSKGEISLKIGDKTIPISLSLTSLQPKLATVGIIVTDYTEKRRTENVILKYQNNLEVYNKQLKDINAELASFVYIASHDLQEPLRKIQTFASRIDENELKSFSKTGLYYFNGMQSAAHRMQTLLRDLLSYSRTNKPELIYANTDLKQVLEEVLNELKQDLVETNANIEIKELCNADIIKFQFKQLLNNLISNSLKFTKANTPPHITVKSQIVEGSKFKELNLSATQKYCHIQLSDKGIGFEQKHSDEIFKVFKRLHGQSEY